MDQCLNLAQLSGDSNMLVQAYHSLGYLHDVHRRAIVCTPGSRRAGKALRFEDASPSCSPLWRRRSRSLLLGVKSLTLWFQGYPQQAVLAAEAPRRLAEQLSHPLSIGVAISDRALLETFRRERTNALEQAKAVVALSEGPRISTYVEGGASLRACSLRTEPHPREQGGYAATWQLGGRRGAHPYSGLSCGGMPGGLRYDEAAAALAETFARIEGKTNALGSRTISPCGGTKIRRSRRSGSRLSSRRWGSAIAGGPIARITRNDEPRPTAGKQGKRDEARTMLTDIYNWFTEGFDTADLKDAKALLDQLG